jgi:methylated-DNA-[protein]-cysteine S-methyltransferase
MIVAVSDGKLVALKFHADDSRLADAEQELRRELRAFEVMRDDTAAGGIARQVEAYVAGQRAGFDLEFDLSWLGTEFRRRVLEECVRIPRGQTVTYAELARRAGRPKAFRAVGHTMATNPIPIVIPCHRVVGSNGSLTGFGGGIDMKRRLLALEGAAMPV